MFPPKTQVQLTSPIDTKQCCPLWLTVCENAENMEVVNCNEQDTVCGEDGAETCRELLSTGP